MSEKDLIKVMAEAYAQGFIDCASIIEKSIRGVTPKKDEMVERFVRGYKNFSKKLNDNDNSPTT